MPLDACKRRSEKAGRRFFVYHYRSFLLDTDDLAVGMGVLDKAGERDVRRISLILAVIFGVATIGLTIWQLGTEFAKPDQSDYALIAIGLAWLSGWYFKAYKSGHSDARRYGAGLDVGIRNSHSSTPVESQSAQQKDDRP